MSGTRSARRDATASHTEFWIAPPFDGPPTGGTLYNAALCSALANAGTTCQRIDVTGARERLASRSPGGYWIDSLYLAAVPELARENVSGAPLHLVVHYLPSLVTFGAAMTPSMLTGEERRALERVHDNLVTSEHMKRVLVGLGVPESRLYVIEPGVSVGANATRTLERRGGGFRALLVANLAPSKGVYDLLVSLGRALQSNVAFRLAVAGSFEMHAGYADLCRTLAEQHPALAGKVIFVGSIAHDEVIRYMTESDVLVSASRMESYGMALAEARAVGLPIVAVRGGNVESHVEARAGGALLADTDALAVELLRLATDPEELGRRRTLASATRRVRSWDDAAAEFRDRVRGERRIERDRDRRTRRGGA